MGLVSDPSGEQVLAAAPPQRIVSLCPGLTELLFDLGLKERVVGVSKQCRFPEVRVREALQMGSNRRPDLRKIQELKPDFIVLDSRETDDSVVGLLKEEYAVWDSVTSSVLGAIAEVRELGQLVGKSANAEWVANKIATRFAEFEDGFKKPDRPARVVFLANYKPWTAFGSHTLPNELLHYLGAENVWASERGIHPVEQKKLPGGMDTTILLAEGPYSFHKRHVPVVNRRFPDCKVRLVREDLLTWQGSRLLRVPGYLAELAKIISS